MDVFTEEDKIETMSEAAKSANGALGTIERIIVNRELQ